MNKGLALVLLLAACSGPGPVVPDNVPLRDTSTSVASETWSPWPQASHDGRRSGSSPESGPQTANLRWTRKLEGNVTPGPVVAPDGTIVAASNAGVLQGLSPTNGKDRWVFDAKGAYGGDLSTSAAVLKDGNILWPGPHNTLYGLDSTGRLLWTEVFPGEPRSPAISADSGTAFVGSSDGTVKAFDVSRGQHRLLWSVALGGYSYGSVALAPDGSGRVYQTTDNKLIAIDQGRIAWSRRLPGLVEVSPAVAPDGTVVVGANDPDEYAFNPGGGVKWTYRHGAHTYSSPVITDDGTAWFGDHRAYVTGVDVKTGSLRARFRGEPIQPRGGNTVGVWTSPVIDGQHNVYWGTRLGHIYGRSPSGALLFDIATGATIDSYPALAGDGLLVVGVTDGRLLGIGPNR